MGWGSGSRWNGEAVVMGWGSGLRVRGVELGYGMTELLYSVCSNTELCNDAVAME